jgi:hypothetical protein
VTFYVQKDLATGPIRFGVSPRKTVDVIDQDSSLSTGGSGQFLRRRTPAFYFADERPIGAPTVPTKASISSTPFWTSLRPDGTRRGYVFLGLLIAGALLVLLGFSVVMRKGPQGWIEVVLGTAMIATPIVKTAQKRKQLREQEERERAEREETERRHREMLASYTAALERLRREPTDAALEELARARDAIELPYDLWSPAAKRTVLDIGFHALERLTPVHAQEIGELMDRASAAAGLSAEDETATKHDLYSTVVWHLLADDRLGDAQADQLRTLRGGLGIWERDAPVETKAGDAFQRLRGVNREKLPRAPCPFPLEFHEYCIHSTRGRYDRTEGTVGITNRRLVLAAKKLQDVPLMKIDDVEVDVDRNRIIVRTAKPMKPIELEVEDPIYTAALLDLATTIDERPRSFA